ncbi:MAG: PBP1A family penicillin-binding protein [Clostridia bacterium]|nr:PBP1A family penicillin-binding protein [Clostridia bacterium]
MDIKNMSKIFFKYFRNIMLVFLICLGGFVIGTVFSIIADAESLDVKNITMDFTSIIYAVDPKTGETVEIETLYDDENRIWVDYEKTPDYLKNAFVAIEDERFYKHHGFDIKRIIGAAFNVFTTGDSSYGGSTITQQLVKNITGDKDPTLTRKLQEIYRAFRMEMALSKEEILELYMNTIYLSNQCNGVQSAANLYFGKDASELTLAESASIAGITQFPTLYDPIANPQNNKEKQELVLGKMLELEYITQEEYDEAVAQDLDILGYRSETENTSTHSYFVDALIDDIIEDLQTENGYTRQIALKMLYSGGLKIYATVNPDIQQKMEQVYENKNSFPVYAGEVQPESAMVVMDPYNGHIVGLVGGRGEKQANRTLNRATQSLRQPGSSIKPLGVYAPAIEYGQITAASYIADTPITIDGWSPRNSDGTFRGMVNIRTAVARSLNIPAVRVLDKLGIDNSYKFMTENLHFDSLVDAQKRENGEIYTDKNLSSLALGGLTDGVTVEQMCAAYCTFVNKGIYTEPTTYATVCDYDGNVILDHDPAPTSIAMSEQTAYIMTDLLQGVVNGGTGSGASLPNMPAAGKTGTTSSDQDRWFVGYTPYYVGAVWVGYDVPNLNGGVYGNPAVSVWRNVMEDVHKDLKYKKFSDVLSMAGLNGVSMCSLSGKRATGNCSLDVRGSMVYTDYFKDGQIPTEYCDQHAEYTGFTVCAETGLMARAGCPEQKQVVALGVDDAQVDKGYISSESCNIHSDQPVSTEGTTETTSPETAETTQTTSEGAVTE